jgi:hypothetical protein
VREIIVLVLLLPLSMLLLVFGVGLFTIGAWLKAWICACEAKFMAAGVWLCVGIFMVDAVANGEAWRDFGPLYVAIMIASVGAAVLKLALLLRRPASSAIRPLRARFSLRGILNSR